MATSNPMPLLPPKSTTVLLESFDPNVYTGTPSTVLYKFLDALVGNSGAGALINQAFFANMTSALQTLYFNDLDYIFGNVGLFQRTPSETYTYNPMSDQLTSYEWDEVMIKDAWFRARIKDFFKACTQGGSPEGIRTGVYSAISANCEIYEVWQFRDYFSQEINLIVAEVNPGGIGEAVDLGRTPPYSGSVIALPGKIGKSDGRNEVVIKPHKKQLSPAEMRVLRDTLDRFCPIESIITINVNGLSVKSPILVAGAAASSTYFEVQQMVTATPAMSKMPPPQLLPTELLPSQTWLYQAQNGNAVLAPYAAFNMAMQSSQYYLATSGSSSPIDTVTYGTLQPDGSIQTAPNYQAFSTQGQLGPKTPYVLADAPDNYPGGKYGMHPLSAPALNPDRTPYVFPYQSQSQYVQAKETQVITQGGVATSQYYQLPVQQSSTTGMTFYPVYAITSVAPANSSTVTQSITAARGQANQRVPNTRNPINFVQPVLPSTPLAASS